MGKLTLKELAERLGVSVSAVSLAINGRPGLSDETRSRILTEVEAAGYQVKKSAAPATRILLLFCRTAAGPLFSGTSGTDYIFMDLQRGNHSILGRGQPAEHRGTAGLRGRPSVQRPAALRRAA